MFLTKHILSKIPLSDDFVAPSPYYLHWLVTCQFFKHIKTASKIDLHAWADSDFNRGVESARVFNTLSVGGLSDTIAMLGDTTKGFEIQSYFVCSQWGKVELHQPLCVLKASAFLNLIGSSGGLSGGGIAGIAVAGIVGAILLAALLAFFLRRRRNQWVCPHLTYFLNLTWDLKWSWLQETPHHFLGRKFLWLALCLKQYRK